MRAGAWSRYIFILFILRELYRNTHPSNPSSDSTVTPRSRAASADIDLSAPSELDPDDPSINDPTCCMKGVVPVETDGFTYGYVFFRYKLMYNLQH
jgi:hypothetical protein